MGNANSGRRPQSQALQLLRGNPGRGKLNDREPQPPVGPVEMPEGLSEGASRIWAELAPICEGMHTLTPADARAFATLCELQSTLTQVASWKTDPEKVEAGIKLEKQYAALIRSYYALFGLEPVSRARIAVGKPEKPPVSKWAGVLK